MGEPLLQQECLYLEINTNTVLLTAARNIRSKRDSKGDF